MNRVLWVFNVITQCHAQPLVSWRKRLSSPVCNFYVGEGALEDAERNGLEEDEQRMRCVCKSDNETQYFENSKRPRDTRVSVGKSHPDLNTNSNVANFNPISSIYQHFNRFSTFKRKKEKKKMHLSLKKKNQAAEKITQKDYRQHGVTLVFSALHCVR